MGYDSCSLELGSLFFTIETATSLGGDFQKLYHLYSLIYSHASRRGKDLWLIHRSSLGHSLPLCALIWDLTSQHTASHFARFEVNSSVFPPWPINWPKNKLPNSRKPSAFSIRTAMVSGAWSEGNWMGGKAAAMRFLRRQRSMPVQGHPWLEGNRSFVHAQANVIGKDLLFRWGKENGFFSTERRLPPWKCHNRLSFMISQWHLRFSIFQAPSPPRNLAQSCAPWDKTPPKLNSWTWSKR